MANTIYKNVPLKQGTDGNGDIILHPQTDIESVYNADSTKRLDVLLNEKLNADNPECTGTFKLGATTLTEEDLIKLKELIAAIEVTS